MVLRFIPKTNVHEFEKENRMKAKHILLLQ